MRRSTRLIWSSADQGVSSVSNLLLSVLIARESSVEVFGVFAIAFTVYQFGLGSSRAFVGEPALIKGTGLSGAPFSNGVLGSSLLIGVVGLLVNLIVACFSPHAYIFIFFAVGFPILMLVDSLRYYLFSVRDPRGAFCVDAIWLIVQLSIYFGALGVGFTSTPVVLASWLGGAFVAVVVTCVLLRSYPSVTSGYTWVRYVGHLSLRFWAEYLAISGVQQSIVYFSTLFSGLVAAAAIRGAQVIAGPLSVVSTGVAMVALPAMSHRGREHHYGGVLRIALAASGALFLVTAAYSAIVLLLPGEIGFALLGDSWEAGREIAPLLLLQIAVGNLTYGATAGLRSLEAAKVSLRLRYATAPVAVTLIIIGATHSPAGALVGAVVGSLVQMSSWWVVFVVLLHRRSR